MSPKGNGLSFIGWGLPCGTERVSVYRGEHILKAGIAIRQGHGVSSTETGAQGNVYCKGMFFNDKLHGYGEQTDTKGTVVRGRFENGSPYGLGSVYLEGDPEPTMEGFLEPDGDGGLELRPGMARGRR